MPKYAILSEKPVSMRMEQGVLAEGKVYQVILESNSGKSEMQEYFVVDGGDVQEILSSAAKNYQEGLDLVEEPEDAPAELQFVIVE